MLDGLFIAIIGAFLLLIGIAFEKKYKTVPRKVQRYIEIPFGLVCLIWGIVTIVMSFIG